MFISHYPKKGSDPFNNNDPFNNDPFKLYSGRLSNPVDVGLNRLLC